MVEPLAVDRVRFARWVRSLTRLPPGRGLPRARGEAEGARAVEEVRLVGSVSFNIFRIAGQRKCIVRCENA